MSGIKSDYNQDDLSAAISASGVSAGDTLFCHSNVGFFGRPDCEMTPAALGKMIVDAVFDVIGNDGTFVVPTFSYSFAKGQDFDPANTPSVCGMLTDYVVNRNDAFRSHHPDFSVAAIGANAVSLTKDVPPNGFGPDSFFARFEELEGKVCNFNFDAGSTFVHYVERTIDVPYRYDKKFFGTLVMDGVRSPGHSINYVHDLSEPMLVAAFEPFHEKAVTSGVATVVPVGRGNVCTLGAQGIRDLIEGNIRSEPFFLTVAYDADEPPKVAQDHSVPDASVSSLNTLASIGITPGSDYAFQVLTDLLPVTIHDVQTGTRVGELIVPERWQLLSATIIDADGQHLLEAQDDAIAAHSRCFSGVVQGKELMSRVIESDTGECVLSGGWRINAAALRSEIDPDAEYKVEISVKNTFSSMRYALLPTANGSTEKPAFASLCGNIRTVTQTIEKIAAERSERSGSILFYVDPFDPEAILGHHLSLTTEAAE